MYRSIQVLLAHWQIVQYKHKLRTQDDSKSNQRSEKGENGENGEKGGAVLTTVVSSRMLKAIAQSEGITYSDTLTGFKWIGNRALEMTKVRTYVSGFCQSL